MKLTQLPLFAGDERYKPFVAIEACPACGREIRTEGDAEGRILSDYRDKAGRCLPCAKKEW